MAVIQARIEERVEQRVKNTKAQRRLDPPANNALIGCDKKLESNGADSATRRLGATKGGWQA